MKTYTAKTLNDAIELACLEAGCTKEEVTYEVIEEEKHLLGIGNKVTISAYTSKDIKEFIFGYLGTFFESMQIPVTIEIVVEDLKEEGVQYRVILDSEQNSVIIGKGGQNLRAISLVTRNAVSTEFKTRVNILVDVNNYKEQKYKKVRAMVTRIAKEVRNTHVSVSLDPMPSDERKVAHQHLQNFKDISTVSEGEGKNRHLIIKYDPE